MAKVKCVQYTSPTCGVCKMTASVVDKAVASFDPSELEFERVCLEGDAVAAAAADGIRTLPTFVFYGEDGVEARRHVGAMNLMQFKNKVKDILAK